jgi:hypothetical protein
VPEPRPIEIATLGQLPATYDVPFETEPVPLTVYEREDAAQRELLSVLRLVDGGVSGKTRRPSVSTIEAITEILDGGDYYPHVPPQNEWEDENAGPIRAVAWPLLVQAGGLAQLSGTRLQLTKTGRQALSEPAAATIRTLWNKWLKTAMFDELARIDCVKGQNGKGKRGLTAASSRREAIADSLDECAAARWIATDELLRYMEASGNDFSVSRDAWGLYIGDPEHGSLGYDGSGRVLDQHYTLALMPEYAATLGVLDDVAERCMRFYDRGLARLIECGDPALTALIANDTRTRKHCLRAGERHVVVPASSEAAFRRALRQVGYVLSTEETLARAPGT